MQEQERARIASDVHDDLGQLLTAMEFDIAFITNKLLPEQKELFERGKKISGLIKVSIDTVQKIASELRPPLLDDLGLMAAMEWQAERYQEYTGIDCKVTFDSEIEIDDKDLNTALFRAFQEALTNAARHADATDVSVRVSMDDSCIVLKVSDNGKGIREEDISEINSFGLSAMRERFYALGGNVEIEGRENKGTTICITVPLRGGQ
jgi:signal transduction histidine kinase